MPQLAPVQQSEAVAKSFSLVQPMGAHNDRFASVTQNSNVLEYDLTADDIHAPRRFVKQHRGWIVNHAP